MTILAQVIGHIFMNLSLQFFTATAMAIILQVAVVGSALIALFLFGEIPSAAQILGSVAGRLRRDRRHHRAEPARAGSVGRGPKHFASRILRNMR